MLRSLQHFKEAWETMVHPRGFAFAFLVLLASKGCLATTQKSLLSRAPQSVLSSASYVAPGPADGSYTKAAEDDRIDSLPGWGKPDFGLFSGMCQDAHALSAVMWASKPSCMS